MKNQPELILLAGPAGCGKTEHCTELFEGTLKNSKDPLRDDLLLILPTAEHRARTIDLILKKGLPGFFQKRITTFDRALKDCLKLGGIDFATDVTRRMILKEIFGRLELHYFDSAQKSNGFLNLIAHTIIELKENLIRPPELRKKLSALKKEFPEFAPKYDDLCLIYEAYEAELSVRHLTDQRDSLRLLEEGLTRGEFEKPELTHVWIDGFTDFSKLQLSFIEFLSRHADRVTVTLTLDQDPLRASLFELVSETHAALEDMGFRTEWMTSKNHRAETDELKILEKNLFREKVREDQFVGVGRPLLQKGQAQGPAPTSDLYGPEKNSPLSIQIFEATGLLGEIEMIAREIKKQVKRHHYHFSDVAVLFRNTNPYVQVIQSVFRKFEIPFEIHERTRLKTTPVARTLASFLEIFLNSWNRKDVFNFLKSSYVKIPVPSLRDSGQSKAAGWSGGGRPLGSPVPDGWSGEAIYDPEIASLTSFARNDRRDDVNQLELAVLKKGIFKDRAYWLKTFPEAESLKQLARYEDEFLSLKNAAQFSAWVKKIMISFGLLDFSKRWDEKTRLDRESVRRIFLLLEELKNKHPEKNLPFLNMSISLADEFITLMEVDIFSVHSRDKN